MRRVGVLNRSDRRGAFNAGVLVGLEATEAGLSFLDNVDNGLRAHVPNPHHGPDDHGALAIMGASAGPPYPPHPFQPHGRTMVIEGDVRTNVPVDPTRLDTFMVRGNTRLNLNVGLHLNAWW